MVDALRSASAVLRPHGHVVDIRPPSAYRPTVTLRRGSRELKVGPILRAPDEDVAAAAAAVRVVVRQGLFEVVFRAAPRWRASYPSLTDLERTIDASELWRLPAATKRRIRKLWRDGDTLEVTRRFSLTALRRSRARR